MDMKQLYRLPLIYHASSVVRAIERALVVVDLPFEVTSLILKKPCVRQSNHERKWHAKSWKVEKKRIIKKILNAVFR
jgi:ketopantoate hydroxymethyltransferase